MATAEELNIIVEAKVKQALKDLGLLEKQTQKTEKTTKDYIKTLAKKAAVAASAYASVRMLTKAVKYASDAAATAEEINSKFNAVFKDQADIVGAWAAELGDKFGRTETQIKGWASTLQDTFVPLGIARGEAADMSKQVTSLAMDLASFNNLDTDIVIRDLQSALVGNTETLRKYGVVANQTEIIQEALNSGLIKNKNELTPQKKALAILQITMKGTADAQGDLARTMDSTANTNKRLNSELQGLAEQAGIAINRGLTPLKSVLAGIVSEMANAIKMKNQFVDLLHEFRETGEIKANGLDELNEKLKIAQQAFDNATFAAQGLETEQVKAAREVLNNIQRQIKKLEAVDDLTNARKEKGRLVLEVQKRISDELEKQNEITAEMNRVAAEQRDKMSSDYGYRLQLLDTEDELEKRILEIEHDREKAIEEANEKYVRSGEEMALLNRYYDRLIENAHNAADATGDIGDSVSDISGPFRDMNAEISTVSEAVIVMTEEWERNFERQKQAAEDAKKTDIELLKERVEAHLTAANQIYSAYSGFTTALGDLRQNEYDREITRIDAQIEAAREAGRDTTALEEKKEKITARFKRKQWAADKRGKLLQASMNVAEAITASLGKPWMIQIVSALGAAQIGAIAATKNPYYKGGVIPEPVLGVGLRSGESYSFGERGPETVIPNGGMGGGVTVNINAAVGSRDEVVRWVVDGINRAKKTGAVALR